MQTPSEAVLHCETLLRTMMEDFQSKDIWPNVRIFIAGMLKRRIELADVYDEVHAALATTLRALYVFWDAFVHAADGRNLEKNRAARADT